MVEHNQLAHICVTASGEYIIKILALYESLQTHSKQNKLWVCCLDHTAYKSLKNMKLENMEIFHVEQLEDSTLRKIRKNRKLNEYCWTLKAPLVHYLLTTYQLESVLYCDGDLFFFSDPKEIFDEWGTASIYLCPQRDAAWVEEKYGKYQAGLIGFRNDSIGLQGLKWWRKRCEEWCSAEPDAFRFGDQKYLDKLPELFSNIKISNHRGINAAPWNCIYNNDYNVQVRNNEVYIEDDKLVAYHFACLSIFNAEEYDLWSLDKLKIRRSIKKHIYEPYIEKIRELVDALAQKGLKLNKFFSNKPISNAKTYYRYTPLRKQMDDTDEFHCFATIISKEYIIKGLALYQSLIQHSNAFKLWICCMDQESLDTLRQLDLKYAEVIPVETIDNNVILLINQDRTLKECCWSMKAPFVQYLLEKYKEIEQIIYCDADMYFFSSPKQIFDEWSTYSIFLCEQRSTQDIESVHGIYQAGLIGFKQEPNSLRILRWWKEKCLEWCYDSHFDGNRWGDQKYLNDIPNLFSNIKIIKNAGIDAAPWNVVMKELEVYTKDNIVYIGTDQLICFHFGSTLMFNKNKYELWKLEKLPFTKEILFNVYYPYLYTLKSLYEEMRRQGIIKKPIDFYSTIPTSYTPKNIIDLQN